MHEENGLAESSIKLFHMLQDVYLELTNMSNEHCSFAMNAATFQKKHSNSTH